MKESPNISERIEVNDLVWVRKVCEKCDCGILGTYFTVTKIRHMTLINCKGLGTIPIDEMGAIGHPSARIDSLPVLIPLPWLKKVPPAANLESFNTTKEKPIAQH